MHSIKDKLLAYCGRASREETFSWVIAEIERNPDRFKELIQCCLSNDSQLEFVAIWAVQHCVEKNPRLIAPFLGDLLDRLKRPSHDAMKRVFMRILMDIELPEEYWGEIAELSFGYVDSPGEAVAIRANAMSVAYKLCELLPELGNELEMIIRTHLEYGKKGFQARGKKILKKLSQKK